MGRLQSWCVGFTFTALVVAVCVAWLDAPIAYFTHGLFSRSSGTLTKLTATPSFYSPLALLILLAFVLRRIALRPFGDLDVALIQSEISTNLARYVLPVLKLAFGRTWPAYYRPSLVDDGVYGFNFFHGGQAYNSFPSGHMASICALTVVLWLTYPRFRAIYALVMGAAAAGLILGSYHFVSDVIAGGFAGGTVAILVIAVWNACARLGIAVAVRRLISPRRHAADAPAKAE